MRPEVQVLPGPLSRPYRGVHMAKKRPVLLLAIVGAVLAVVRRKKAGKAEADLWHEATSAPDLR